MTTPTISLNLAGESTSVREMLYANELLFVTFTSGVTYCYTGVPFATVKKVVGSDSIGSALHSEVISQPFAYDRLTK